MTEPAMSCPELEALSAELALGTVSGAERASALTHMAGCRSCRNQVEQLARAADRLLLLAPAAEPPPGFESRVLSRISGWTPAQGGLTVARPPRASRRRVLVGAVGIAVAAALSGAGATALLRDGGGAAPAGEVRTALARDDGGRWTCRAVVYGESPTWLVVSLDRSDRLSASFSVEALQAGSPDVLPVGELTIRDGHGSLAAVIELPPDRVDAIRVLDAGGRVRYEVDFPST